MQGAIATAPVDPSLRAARLATFTKHAVRNVRIISYSYLVDGLVLGGFAWAGTVPWWPVAIYTLLGLLVGAAWTQAFRRGWTLRFEDPHLPMSLSACHQVLQLVGIALMPQLGFVFLMVLFIVFTSLAMRVSPRQAAAACGAICLGAALVLGWTGAPMRIPDASRVEQVLAVGFVSLTLWQCIWIGMYNGSMTASLKKRSLELAALTAQVERLAHHDELTGLLNRRSLLAVLADEQRRADRTGLALTVGLLDLDHFKAVNDSLGHPAGDRTLQRFAATVQDVSRTTDRFGRYGGEEFLVVFSGASVDEAQVPVERFRAALHARGWDDVSPGLEVTFSCGLAAYRSGETLEDLLRRADEALYRAKDAGRNCTRTAT